MQTLDMNNIVCFHVKPYQFEYINNLYSKTKRCMHDEIMLTTVNSGNIKLGFVTNFVY